MNLIFKAIKDKFSSTAGLSSLVGRLTVGRTSEKLDVKDAPYAVVSLVSDTLDFGYSDTTGLDYANIQISVFGTGLAVTEALRAAIQTALHNAALTMDNSKTVFGRAKDKGLIVEPKNANSNSVFHCFTVFEFIVNN